MDMTREEIYEDQLEKLKASDRHKNLTEEELIERANELTDIIIKASN